MREERGALPLPTGLQHIPSWYDSVPPLLYKAKTMDNLATRCDGILYHDYTHRHNEVVRCIHLYLCRMYSIKVFPRIPNHSLREVIANENLEIHVDRITYEPQEDHPIS